MMRSIGVIFLFLFSISIAKAERVLVGDVRLAAQSIQFEHQTRVLQLMDWNDSLLVNRKNWIVRYDSLLSDSTALTSAERSFIRFDACMLSFSVQPSGFNYALLKNAYRAFQVDGLQSEDFSIVLNAWMLEASLSQNDLETAFALQSKMHAFQEEKWRDEEMSLLASSDSLLKELETGTKEHASMLKSVNETLMQWHLIAIAAIVGLLVLLGIYLGQKSRWNKQRSALKAKADDTSEKEALVQKLEESRRELVELKTLAKKRVEASAPVVQPIIESKGLSVAEIAEWNEELQQALAKIKTHCEAGKNSMDVPTYMSIVNDVTRLSSRAAKKSEQWMATQSGK